MKSQISSILLFSLSLEVILIGSSSTSTSKSFVTALTPPGVAQRLGQRQGLWLHCLGINTHLVPHSKDHVHVCSLFPVKSQGGYDDGKNYCPKDCCVRGSPSLIHSLQQSRGIRLFTGIGMGRRRRRRRGGNNISSLFANDSNNGDGNETSSNNNEGDNGNNGNNDMKKITTARAGGRSQSQVKRMGSQEPVKVQLSVKEEEEPNAITKFAKNALPVLLFFLIVKSLLGGLFGGDGDGGGSGGSYVYYQSTVYESTSYDSNGQSERVRKESFKTNIPGYTPATGERDNSNYRNEMRKLNDEIERDLGNVYRDTYRSTIVEDFYD